MDMPTINIDFTKLLAFPQKMQKSILAFGMEFNLKGGSDRIIEEGGLHRKCQL